MGVTSPASSLADREGRRSTLTILLLALVFVGLVAESPVELDAALYCGRWRSIFAILGPIVSPIPGISLTPWQLLLMCMASFSLGAQNMRRHEPTMDRAIYVALGATAITFLWGLLMGGSAYFAYYQLWRLLLALLLAFIISSVLRTERDLAKLGKMLVLVGLIRATLCIYYYWTYLRGTDDPTCQYVTNHDDTLLFVLVIEITAIWAIMTGGRRAFWIAAFVGAYVLYAIIINNRRLAWVELAFGIPLIYVLIGRGPVRSKINRWAMITAVPAVLYVAVGSVSSSPIFAPVHALFTTGSVTDNSSLARIEEIRNLLRTLFDVGNPIVGTGWGRPYAMVERAYNNYDKAWILAPYTPHNSLIGLAAFSGIVGVAGILGVIPVAAYLATRGYRRAEGNPVLRSAAMVSIGTFCAYGVHCYGDIGLQSFPGAILLGVALATAARVASLADASSSAQPLQAAARTKAAELLKSRSPQPLSRMKRSPDKKSQVPG
jgi:hypothetical protein